MEKKGNKKTLPSFKIQKIPFNGKSLNLIDKFLIIGYDQFFFDREFPKIIDDIKKKQQKAPQTVEHSILIRPIVLNEIVFDYEKQLLDNELILELLFPSKIIFYIFSTLHSIEPWYLIFSINPQDNYKSKKSYNGFGYLFFNPFRISNNLFIYYPKVFFILSEYPYFTSFLDLCKFFLTMISNKDSIIPIESLIYNFIKFIPAPIETSINISITNKKHLRLNKNLRRAEYKSGKSLVFKDNNIFSSSPNKKLKNEKKNANNIEERKFEEANLVEKYYPKIEETDIFFKQLSGYPIAQIDLTIFFSLLPFELIIEVFFFTFLEHDILFFSQNLELLNIVLYCFYLFNFPCNDAIYFWHILSVSIEDFLEGNSTFVGKTCSTMLGIHGAYNSSYKTTKRIKEHFIVDLDNRKNFLRARDFNAESAKKTMKLMNWVKSIISKSKASDNSKLEGILLQLIIELREHSAQADLLTHNVHKINLHKMYKDSKSIQMQNTNIQECFYRFFFRILQLFNSFEMCDMLNGEEYSNSSVKEKIKNYITSNLYQDANFIVRYKYIAESSNEHETIFHLKFKDCSKYNSFIINFMLYYETVDMYKIPLLISEEIISRTQKMEGQDAKNIDLKNLFDLFNYFYKIKKQESILDITKKFFQKPKKLLITDINIKDLFFPDEPGNILKEICAREQIDEQNIFGKIKKKYFYNYTKYELSMKLLMRYIYELEQMRDEELKSNFPVLEIKRLNVKEFKEIHTSAISDLVEEFFIFKQIITYKQLINLSIFMILDITTEITLDNRKETDVAFAFKILTKKTRNLKHVPSDNLRQFYINIQCFRQYITHLLTFYIKLYDKYDKEEKKQKFILSCFNEIIQQKEILDIIPNREFMECVNWFKGNKEDIIKRRNCFEENFQKDIGENNRNIFFNIKWDTAHIKNYTEKEEPKILMHLALCLGQFALDNYIPKYGESPIDKNESDDIKLQEIDPQFIFCSYEENSEKQMVISLFNPRKLFNQTKKIFLKFSENFTFKNEDKTSLIEILWNQIFYISKAKTIVEHKKEIESKDDKENLKKKKVLIEKELQDIYGEDERRILLPILLSTFKSIIMFPN